MPPALSTLPAVLHVATVHWRNPHWIPVQQTYLRRFAPANTQIWASLDELDGDHSAGFDHVTSIPTTGHGEHSFNGGHGEKLEELARRISEVGGPDDALLFLDGDAFPVGPLDPVIATNQTLTAVRRDENRGDRQPHPCFTLTTVGFWNRIGGTWGHDWVSSAGARDIGGELLQTLVKDDITWRPLLRMNTTDLHPLWFGVYGDSSPVVYHHGAGFRPRVDRADRPSARALFPESVPVLGRAERSLRWRSRQRSILRRRYQREAERLNATVQGWIDTDDNIADRFV
jgi:hypothetical protein